MIVQVPIIHCATCETPYVLRMSFVGPELRMEYLFQRDCKHKGEHLLSAETAPLTVADPVGEGEQR
jgi:hypothetical protein